MHPLERREKRFKSDKEVYVGAGSEYLLKDCVYKNPFQSKTDSKLLLTGKLLKVSEKGCKCKPEKNQTAVS